MMPPRGMGNPFVGGQQLGMPPPGVPFGYMNRAGPGRPPPSAMMGAAPAGTLNRGAGSPPPSKNSPHHGPQPNPSVAGLTPPVTARSRQLLATQNKTVSSLTSLGQSSARTLSVPSTPTLPSALPSDGQGTKAEVLTAPSQQQPDLARSGFVPKRRTGPDFARIPAEVPPARADSARADSARLARVERLPVAEGHPEDEVEALRSARGSRGNSTGRDKYGVDGVELRNDSQMVFLNSSQASQLGRSAATNPNSFAAMERVAEMTVELQEKDEQVARLKDLIDRQAEQLREYEARAQEAERLMHRARTDLQKERQQRASAELRQRDLMRQLQEQERELARSLRRGEYTKGLEDKVAELEDKLSNAGSRDSSLMESSSEVSRSGESRPRTAPRVADHVSRTSSQASSAAGSSRGPRPSSRSVSSASVSSVQSGTSSVRAELRKKLELSGPNKTMRAKRVEFRHLCEIKGLGNPPTPVRLLMQVMCILFSIPPARKRDEHNRPYEDYWDVAKKKLLADPYFCTKLHHFPRPLSDELRAKIEPYLSDPEFSQDRLQRVNLASAHLGAWVRTLVKE